MPIFRILSALIQYMFWNAARPCPGSVDFLLDEPIAVTDDRRIPTIYEIWNWPPLTEAETEKYAIVHVMIYEASIDILCPALALRMTGDSFKLLPHPDYDPEDEDWQFLPGAVVRTETRHFSPQQTALKTAHTVLLAVEQIEPPPQPVPIYVRLAAPNQSQVQRVGAISLGNHLFQLPTQQEDAPAHEIWEFSPGAIVRCETTFGRHGVYGVMAIGYYVDAEKINRMLIKADIEGLIEAGAPEDEYESEAQVIAATLADLREVRYTQERILWEIKKIWIQYFNLTKRDLTVRLPQLTAVADEIYQHSIAPINPIP